MMNKTQITLIITGFIILALMATNPSIEDHREGVKKMYKEKLQKDNRDGNENLASQIGSGIGMMIGDGLINKMVSRENYLLFSITEITLDGKTKNVGIGILGQVFVNNYDNIKKKFEINENSNFGALTEDAGNDSASLEIQDEFNNQNSDIKEVYIDDPSIKKQKENSNTDIKDENIYENVDTEAEFPGGKENWTRYITREFERNIDELQEDGGSGTVVINFVVDKEGNVSEVHALNCDDAKVGNCLSPNSKLAEISINAIKKGPNWVPAQLNGLVVKSLRRKPVTFILSNE